MLWLFHLLFLLRTTTSSHFVLFATRATETNISRVNTRADQPLVIQIQTIGKMSDVATAISAHNSSGLYGVRFLNDVMLFDDPIARYPVPHRWPLTYKVRNGSDIYYCTRSMWEKRIALFQLMSKDDHRYGEHRLSRTELPGS